MNSTCAKLVHKQKQVIFIYVTKIFTIVNMLIRDQATIASTAPSQERMECTSVKKMIASTMHASNV